MDKINKLSHKEILLNKLDRNKELLFPIIVIIIGFMIRLVNTSVLLENELHYFRQCQTAITIQCYLKDGWSLFHYEMPVFGKNWQIILECPIYQSIVFGVMKMFHAVNIDFCCKIVSIVIFMLSTIYLWKIVCLINSSQSACWVVAVYVFSPYNIYWSRAALIDYTSVLFALAYVYYFIKWLERDSKKSYVFAMFFGGLAYLQKGTTMIPTVIFLGGIILLYYYNECKEKKETLFIYIKNFFSFPARNIFTLLLCIIPVVPGVLWMHYSDLSNESYYYTQWLSSSVLKEWDFGTIQQRMLLSDWKIILERVLSLVCGNAIIFLLLLFFIFLLSNSKIIYISIASLVGCSLTILILFNLYVIHDYYFIALSPFFSIITGMGLYSGVELYRKKIRKHRWIIIPIAFLILFSTMNHDWDYIRRVIYPNLSQNRMGNIVTRLTDEDDRIYIVGLDWNPTLLYSANRKGFMEIENAWDRDRIYNDIICKDKYTTFVSYNPVSYYTYVKEYENRVHYYGKYFCVCKVLDKNIGLVDKSKYIKMEPNTEYSWKNNLFMINDTNTNIIRIYKMHIKFVDGSEGDCDVCIPKGDDTHYFSFMFDKKIDRISIPDSGYNMYMYDIK